MRCRRSSTVTVLLLVVAVELDAPDAAAVGRRIERVGAGLVLQVVHRLERQPATEPEPPYGRILASRVGYLRGEDAKVGGYENPVRVDWINDNILGRRERQVPTDVGPVGTAIDGAKNVRVAVGV